jgi:hypothetical protein
MQEDLMARRTVTLRILSRLLALAILPTSALAQAAHILPLQLGAPVVGKPFSGTRTLDYEPAQNSSDPVPYHAEEKQFRDSAGRTRSEFTYPGRLPTIDILDFVAHLHYHWVVGDSVATRSPFPEVAPSTREPAKLDADAPVVEGLPTRYSHSVTGKDKIEKSIESWYSPDLQLAMITIINQPGVGKTTYRFVHVSHAEPDASLFRVPEGIAIEDIHKSAPPAPANQETSSPAKLAPDKPPLPHAIEDDNYLEALARFHAAVPRWLPLNSSYHRHSDIRLIDIYGKESSATVDDWHKGQLERDEERASGWSSTVVWGTEQYWSTHEGISPMHLADLPDLTPRPGPVERRIRIYAQGYVEMKQLKIEGTNLRCSGKYAGAELCFNAATGFPVSAALDGELVVYEQWGEFNGANYPTRLALYRNHRLQMEATTTVTPLNDASDALFQPIPGVTPISNSIPVSREDGHRVLWWGQIGGSDYGEALVRVYVDESGLVRRAELLDVDDISLGPKAISAAKSTVYMPAEKDGKRVPFETTFQTSNWSRTDPIRVAATSLQSQGTD